MQLELLNDQGQAASKVDAPETVFGREYNEALVHQVVTAYLANGRRGTRAQKARGDVNKSTAKPWRQKGTGRARVGEIRNPLWRKGGTVFGPQPRSYAYQLPKKVELGALRAALMQKMRDGVVGAQPRPPLLVDAQLEIVGEVCGNVFDEERDVLVHHLHVAEDLPAVLQDQHRVAVAAEPVSVFRQSHRLSAV